MQNRKKQKNSMEKFRVGKRIENNGGEFVGSETGGKDRTNYLAGKGGHAKRIYNKWAGVETWRCK